MDTQLKEAIALVRSGEREAAQKQLVSFLDEKPEEAQGWYLLSLLVESPQKQATYLSKAVAINPNHAKAQAQLTTLQRAGTLAPTSTILSEADVPEDIVAQAEGETLPDWLIAEQGMELPTTPEVNEELVDTAVPNETLPDWLKEPAAIPQEENSDPSDPIEESPTVVGQTAQADDEPSKTVDALRQQTAATTVSKQPAKKQAKAKPAANQNTTGLNIILTLLIVLAIVVMVMLAFLILT